MNQQVTIGVCLVVMLLFTGTVCFAASIPADELDEKKIYFGNADDFETPAEVDYLAVVKATPEYQKIKADKVESGSAQYFILMS